jgi:hypothetical protein
VAGSCERSNKLLGSIKSEKCFVWQTVSSGKALIHGVNLLFILNLLPFFTYDSLRLIHHGDDHDVKTPTKNAQIGK